MPKRSSTAKPDAPKRTGTPHDFTTIARRVVEQAIGEKLDGSALPDPHAGKNPAAVALGRLGGLKGGKARAAALSLRAKEGTVQGRLLYFFASDQRRLVVVVHGFIKKTKALDPHDIAVARRRMLDIQRGAISYVHFKQHQPY